MKYRGKKIEGRNKEIIPIPRPEGNVIFIAEAVQDWDQFEKLTKEPDIPVRIKPGGVKVENVNDLAYQKAMSEYAVLRTHWLVLKSLQNSPDLEWETVDMEKPETWSNYETELKESGFTLLEIGRIVRGVMIANSLDESMIDAAKHDFLAGLGEVEA